MKLTSYAIRHSSGTRRAVWGYVYTEDGRAYGIDRRPETRRWTITDVATGMIPGATSYPTRAAAVADLERIADNMRRRVSSAKLEQLAREFAAMPEGAPLYDRPAPRKPSALRYKLERATVRTIDAKGYNHDAPDTYTDRPGYAFTAEDGREYGLVKGYRDAKLWYTIDRASGRWIVAESTRAAVLDKHADAVGRIAPDYFTSPAYRSMVASFNAWTPAA